jgi:hypothetical protein
MRSLFFSISIAVLILLGLFAFHRILEPNRICLSWEGARELSFQGQSVPSCESVSRLQRPLVAAPAWDWARRLNDLSRLSWLKESSIPVSIQIDEKNPHTFSVENQLVTIGFGLAQKAGQLEHAAILGWVMTNWPDRLETTQEAMADIFTWLVVGDESWEDPVHEQTVSPSTYIRYSLTPSSVKTYCISPFRSLKDLTACENGKTEMMPPSHLLRPLISWTLWSFVKGLPSSKQIHFLKSVMTEKFSENAAVEEEAGLSRQLWAKDRIVFLLSRWGLTDQLERRDLTRALNKSDLNMPLSFDLTVEVTDLHLQDRVQESLRKWSSFYPRLRVLFVANQKKIVFPENVPVDFSASELETRHYVMLACGWPKPGESFSPKSHSFAAYQICGDDTLPSWTELVSSRPTTLESRANLKPVLQF